MLGIALAYRALNKQAVSAGAAYQWTSSVFGKLPGFFSGWALLIAALVFMVTGSIPAATATLNFIDPSLTGNVFVTASVASLWFVVVALVLIMGIEITSKVQLVMTGIELVILTFVLIAAFVHVAKAGASCHCVSARRPSLPANFCTPTSPTVRRCDWVSLQIQPMLTVACSRRG